MKKFRAFLKSFYKAVIVQHKYKAFWTLLTDKKFRADLDRLHELTKHCTSTKMMWIDHQDIMLGHKTIYPDYEDYLRANDNVLILPIRVVGTCGVVGCKYIIVDGNHRLYALAHRSIKYGNGTILCEVMV